MSPRSAASQIQQMLDMQHQMNTKVHPQWFNQGFAWHRAIWVECAEMLDHFGWKWWKKQNPDTEQVMLELVDILHFGLSIRIDGQTSFDVISETLASELEQPSLGDDFPATLERLASAAVTNKSFDARAFAGCMQQIGLSFDQMYRMYVGKNTLNMFRQNKGYQSGEYIKVWDNREDNEHLMDILHRLDSQSVQFAKEVYQELERVYPA
ncbi:MULTISPECIES: dUTP diphosphatase [unclassified Motilimonas]|uniref:dUTP diphosphatase n=1 Tax=Motilimonas TaxID=1914248 RepID=UPI001E31AF57|nr:MULTISPECIES: dUTP diphosphatase [unclassified Motilimonas]MCE0558453.1 dUTP diphosphatase [Motilimonas sp. E26]MDO6526575.1 dUTP diphosphatase [Motilimonas sp. 1_MG-2023]